ncbi:AAA family ATPase [Paenibacillus planticolens]|nr:AAA family ATPase [Paenibacillus planticolens]
MYVWIGEYKAIHKQGFQLGGELQCEYDTDACRLTVMENPRFVKGFFDLPCSMSKVARISNITAIIGENGAGKSSLLHYMKQLFGAPWIKRDIPALLVYRGPKEEIIAFCHKACPIKEVIPATVQVKPLEKLDDYDLNAIYYSNVFDQQTEEHYYRGGLRNISTNYLSREDGRTGYYYKGKSELEIHKLEEVHRQIRFVSSPESRLIKKRFQLPEVIYLRIKDVTVEVMYHELKNFPVTEFVKELIVKLREVPLTSQSAPYDTAYRRELFMQRLMVRTVEQLFLGMTPIGLTTLLNNDFPKFKTLQRKHLYDKVIAWLQIIKFQLGKNPSSEQVQFINGLWDLLFFFDRCFANNRLQFYGDAIVLRIKEDDKLIKELMSIEEKCISPTSMFEFDWRDLSSGEKALLNMYSRFYTVVESGETLPVLGESLTILIDEGELYLHPQWQKRLFLDLISFLPGLYGRYGVQTIQIIMTSNSPFILSDLPDTHIIFMHKHEGKTGVLLDLEDQRQTFAANIHSLLSHSFFLREGMIGEFAKLKINETVDLLLNGNRTEVNRQLEKIEYIISIVGEPILRHKLIGLLQDRISTATISLEDRIQVLETELRKLKRGKLDD